MPSNIFATTGTNVSVLFIDKSGHDDAVLIDASKLGEKRKEGKNQKTYLRPDEIEQIVDTFNRREQVDDFSVVVPLDKIKEKGCSFSAGQYFEIKIEHIDITPEEFAAKMDAYKKSLSEKFAKGRELEDEILKQLERLVQ